MADQRKPLSLSAEEIAFVNEGKAKDNGFVKPDNAKPIDAQPVAPDISELQQPKKEPMVRLTVDLPVDMHQELKLLATQNRLKMSAVVRHVLKMYIEQNKQA